MASINAVVLSLAYVLGLLLTGISQEIAGISVEAIALLGSGIVLAILIPRCWRGSPKPGIWLIAGLIGVAAVFYFQWRIPHPSSTDISHLINSSQQGSTSQVFTVRGEIETVPRLTRSQRIQFQLKAILAAPTLTEGIVPIPGSVSGKVYVTVPLLQGTGLYPGQTVNVTGSLYIPKAAANPGGFDFQAYLAQEGIFVGMNGKQVEQLAGGEQILSPVALIQRSLYQIRRRIVRSQVAGLGVPEGPLTSALFLGQTGVDVPYDIRDTFVQVGLAHALAASGSQVSLLIGMILMLTKHLSANGQLLIGSTTLLTYIGLAGLQPSILRAGVMGFVALWALTLERKVKPLGAILLAATGLLLVKPTWIWDLGFQLSFLATLGLLVTVPVLNKRLDWLPTAIAPLISVPLAAYLWTLPLQLYAFGVVSPYSILINVLAVPLITAISIGSGINALIALISPALGSIASQVLYYPTHLFVKLAELGNRLPGNSIAIGTITVSQLILLYGLYSLLWRQPRLHRYWWMVGAICIGLIAIPMCYAYSSLLQVTVLATVEAPTLLVQNRGTTMLVGSGDDADATYTVLPFLKQQGINQIDWAIAPNPTAASATGWLRIAKSLPIQTLYGNLPSAQEDARSAYLAQVAFDTLKAKHQNYSPLNKISTITTKDSQLHLISTTPLSLELKLGNQRWLLLSQTTPAAQTSLITQTQLPKVDALWWCGEELDESLLATVNPKVAIASARTISPATEAWFKKNGTIAYSTGRDGAIEWTPNQGFVTTLTSNER
jgi:competence protein ComEC